MAYKLLTRRFPFEGDNAQIMHGHLAVAPQPPSAFCPNIPSRVDQVMLQALAKNIEDRFPSVQVFADAFEQAWQSENFAPEPETPQGPNISQEEQPVVNPKPVPRRHVFALAIGVGATVGGGGVWALSRFLFSPVSPSTPPLIPTPTSTPTPAPNLAFVDTNHSNDLLIMSSSDGMNWTGSQQIGQTSSSAPALVVLENTLCLAFAGTDSDHALLMIFSTDGVNWTGSRRIGQASSQAPALAEWNEALVLAFVVNDGSNDLLLISSRK